MAFHNLTEFLQMGGYAGYVWTAYGFCFLGFTIKYFQVKNKKTSLTKYLKEKYESNS